MPDVITATEYVEINSVPLATPAWRCANLTSLFMPPRVRGSDRRIPYAKGEDPLRRIYDKAEHSLPLLIWGNRKRDGTNHTNVRDGLVANIDILESELVDPDAVVAEPGTKLLRLHLPGSIRSAQCHVIELIPGDTIAPSLIRASLEIVVPTGLLVPE
jgi:hypothetical protein